MAVLLKNLYSIINKKHDAKDKDRAFTFIEFIKEFGYDNSTSSFLNDYKYYLSEWAKYSQNSKNINDKDFIKTSLIETLKSIALTYSSYEEQDFLANIDWNNEMHRKAIIPFFAEKIKNICNFYKNKRQEAHLVVNKNKLKGSRISLEQIIYDKIIDFYFENKNLKPQISRLQHDLLISIEEYVDIYSEYFDIPRNKVCTDKSRKELIEANINNVNYEDYINISKIISDILFDGEIYLEEIPLIAQVSLDLSQKCAGDVATLRDTLLNEATINQVTITDQISLRRKLYEKYLGCDLYYIYCESPEKIYINLLTKAENPSGNLLNCGTADIAVVEADKLKLLSNIGLFFKPDKIGILKINANDFSWKVDKSKLTPDTFYVFPDPNKYGDIGNNKAIDYPLIYEYKLDNYIKNLSSGWAKDDPLAFISTTTWNTYYSKQDDDYILNDNKDYNYSFTSLANLGIISDYQVDAYGNEYALIKGYKNKDGILEIPAKFQLPTISYEKGTLDNSNIESIEPTDILLNGGYFEDPRVKEPLIFPYNERIRFANDYIWSGIIPQENTFSRPDAMCASIDLGSFTDKSIVQYSDHFVSSSNTANEILTSKTADLTGAGVVFINFLSQAANANIRIVNKSFSDIGSESGILYIKNLSKTENFGIEAFAEKDIKKYAIINDVLVLEKDSGVIFYNYDPDSLSYKLIDEINIDNSIYKVLYNETEESFYIAILSPIKISNESYDYITSFNLAIHKMPLATKRIKYNIINTANDINFIQEIISKDEEFDNFMLETEHEMPKDFIFTYNNNLDTYLIAYLLNDNSSYPYLYEHTFRLYNKSRFYNTLKSTVYYNINESSSTRYNLFNPTIDTSAVINQEPFFIQI